MSRRALIRRFPSAYTLFNRLLGLPSWIASALGDPNKPKSRSAKLNIETMEDRCLPSGGPLLPNPVIFVGAGSGQAPVLNEYNALTGALNFSDTVYSSLFTGGVRVATADFTGDGFPDALVAPGPGALPIVHVIDGETGDPISGPLGSLQVFPSYMLGGVYVAAADVTGSGTPDVIAATETASGPLVRVFDSAGTMVDQFTVSGLAFRFGFSIAAADFSGTGTGKADIVIGAGASSEVRVYDAATGEPVAGPLGDFYAFGHGFSTGVTVAADTTAGDVNGDGIPDIVVGTGPGVPDQVKVFNGANASPIDTITPFGGTSRSGVQVGLAQVNDGARADIVVGTDTGPQDQVAVYSSVTGEQLPAPMGTYSPFGMDRGGVSVAASNDPANPMLSILIDGNAGSPTLDAGQSFDLQGELSGLLSPPTVPTGTVTFSIGTDTLGTEPVSEIDSSQSISSAFTPPSLVGQRHFFRCNILSLLTGMALHLV